MNDPRTDPRRTSPRLRRALAAAGIEFTKIVAGHGSQGPNYTIIGCDVEEVSAWAEANGVRHTDATHPEYRFIIISGNTDLADAVGVPA